MEDVVVVGAGGFGRDAVDILDALNQVPSEPSYRLLGVIDDSPSSTNLSRMRDMGVPYLGTTIDWLGAGAQSRFVCAVGNPLDRAKLSSRLESKGVKAVTLVHPSVLLGRNSRIGEGSVICAGTQVSANVSIGRHVHLNARTIIGHDSTLADFVSVNPGAIVSGNVSVMESAVVGAGAVVLQGLNIGSRSTVGASACVVKSVQDSAIVKGVPAR